MTFLSSKVCVLFVQISPAVVVVAAEAPAAVAEPLGQKKTHLKSAESPVQNESNSRLRTRKCHSG